MTRLRGNQRAILGWVGGLIEDAEPGSVALGTIAEGRNFVPTPSGVLAVRGGSRIVTTLHDDAGSPAELSHVCLLVPFNPVGAIAIGWSNGQNKHYAYRLTVDMDWFVVNEATSRKDLTAAPSTTWDNASAPARPVAAELWEKLFIADATATLADRNEFLSFASDATVVRPTFSFDGGAAEALFPYTLEEYNGVLFIAGYGTGGDEDRPEMLRHSYLGRSPDDTTGGAEGFDADAYLLLGAKGKRVTALRQGRGLLLVAKANEFYRISGFGRAYPGWQYSVENVDNPKGWGVLGPHALCFAEGYWYGVGAQGPFRTDGFAVESLVGPRQRSWRAINNAEYACAAYDPERRVVRFSLHPSEAATGRSATYPWTLWTWDVQREVYAPDQLYGLDVFMFGAIPTPEGESVASLGPTAAPTIAAAASATVVGWTANWTNGDATAETEVWVKEGASGTYMLEGSVAATVTSLVVTGKTNHTAYYYKVRHRKSGIVSSFSAETQAQTLITAPSVGASVTSGLVVSITHSPGTVTVTVESSDLTTGGGWVVQDTLTGRAAGTDYDTPTSGMVSGHLVQFRAKLTDALWPTPDSTYGVSGPVTIP